MTDNRFNPAYDNKIFQKFSKKTIANKTQNKESFCEENGLPYDKRIPLICVTYPLSDQNNVNMIQDVMVGILEQPVQIVLVGIGTEKYQKFFTQMADEHSGKLVILPNNEDEKRKIYAAADVMVVASDSPECMQEAKHGMRYGVVPIIPETDFADDYNPNQEKGNAFVYLKNSPWNLFASLIRAIENCRFPYDWKNIQAAAMEIQ